MPGTRKRGSRLRRVEISGRVGPEIQEKLIRHEFVISIVALALGGICVLAGLVLVILGLNGAVQWSISAFGVESRLANASPGIILFVAGVIIILRNRFVVKIRIGK